MKLGELAASVQWEFGIIVSDAGLEQAAINAARQFHGYGDLRCIAADPTIAINADTEIADGEWAVIKPLYMLYIERENARGLEASRANGLEVYGRSIDSIEPDIRQYETVDLPRMAFACLPESI